MTISNFMSRVKRNQIYIYIYIYIYRERERERERDTLGKAKTVTILRPEGEREREITETLRVGSQTGKHRLTGTVASDEGMQWPRGRQLRNTCCPSKPVSYQCL
jgi:hypothetical protein